MRSHHSSPARAEGSALPAKWKRWVCSSDDSQQGPDTKFHLRAQEEMGTCGAVTVLKTDSQLSQGGRQMETGVPSTGSGQEGEEAPGLMWSRG